VLMFWLIFYSLLAETALINVGLLVVRNLSGHKGAIRNVELYPFGEYAASTSADHNVKVC